MSKIGIVGSGTWGTALANMLSNTNNDVTLWSFQESEVNSLKSTHTHPNLPGATLSNNIVFTSSLEETCKNKDVIVFAVPSAFMRQTAIKTKDFISENQIVISVSKGIEKDTLFTMCEVIEDAINKPLKLVALSGPTHAEEVAIGLPTLIVSASKDELAAKEVLKIFNNETLRVYTNSDIKGVELCGSLKNIIALASGMAEGLGFGDNAKAAIVTRGLTEITRLGLAMGCQKETFYGLTGIGDIVVTATSKHSRNHNAGVLLGKGYSLEETLKQIGMVVEGVYALDAAKELEKKYNVELPIVDVVYSILKEGNDVKRALPLLFGRTNKSEI